MTHGKWWKTAVGYEIYIRSFADSTGNGIGDLNGITSKLDYLSGLGVDLLWLTPFYPSPFVDYGYDVADYADVDPLFGTLADYDRLIEEAHNRDMRVIVDIVPNHSSSNHHWFQEALKGPDNAFRDYYIWADPSAEGGYPNNWISMFGGPAWTFDEASGQYYLHLFLAEQPDLNWSNEAVHRAFEDVLRFWLDRGADGFRIDVAHALAKDPELRSNPEIKPWSPADNRWDQWDSFEHNYDILQPAVLDIYESWQKVVAPYNAFLLGETYVLDSAELALLLNAEGLHAGFWLKSMHIGWDADEIRACIDAPMQTITDPSKVGWVAASHDESRPPSRFGGGDLGRRRSLALSTILFGLPGLPVLYQGEELGLVDGIVPEHLNADPVGTDVTMSRDVCRTPMPWTGELPSMGFSTAETTWLPMGGRSIEDTVEWQQGRDDSWLAHYSALIRSRKAHPELVTDPFAWLHLDPSLLAFQRGRIVVIANVGETVKTANVRGSVIYSTHGREGSVDGPEIAPAEAIWLDS